jgi:lipopolysaccharide transport system permease protein
MDKLGQVQGEGDWIQTKITMTAIDAPLDLVIIKPRHGLSALDIKSVWQFRDLLLAFADRDIRLRYRQTFLGAAWVILQPLMGASIFSLVFGLIAKMPSHGAPYFLISYSGLLGWTLFFGTLTRISPSLIANSTLIRKIFFPRILIPLGVIPSVLLDFVVSLLIMLAMLVAYRITPNWTMLLIPVCIFILLAMSLGAGLIAASLAVKYRDILHLVPFVVQLLMYGSPVGYSADAVPHRLIQYYFLLNPLSAPIDTFRIAFIKSGTLHLGYLAYSLAVSIMVLIIGLVVFRRFEREFADVI